MLFRECAQKFLPTAHSFCLGEVNLGESEGMDGILGSLEESLEVTTAERCLGLYQSYGEDVVEDVVERLTNRSCLPSQNSRKRNHCCGKVSRSENLKGKY